MPSTAAERAEAARVFEAQRGYLFSIAYRLLGSVGDAEDAVQDAYLRWAQLDAAGSADVRSPRAFLATTVVRLCLDQLRSARARREVYVGPWLPEPLLTTDRADLTETVVLRESLSFAFLLMLEVLSPVERAVFVLRTVFDYDYAEIAPIVERSVANCRQIFRRARQRLGEQDAPPPREAAEQAQVIGALVRATAAGDVGSLMNLLAADAVSISDGGGKALAALQPVRTRDRVARGFLGTLQKMPPDAVRLEEINGQPAIIGMRGEQVLGVVLVEVRDGQIQVLYALANPDKLAPLGRALAGHVPADDTVQSPLPDSN